MIKTIVIFILVLSLLDLGATYLYISKFHEMFPQLNATDLEANPILRTTMNIFGIDKGMIIGGIIVLGLLLLITWTMAEKWLYYLLGVFSMMLVYHTLNFKQLLSLG